MIDLVDLLAGRIDAAAMTPEARATVIRDAERQGLGARLSRLHPDFTGLGAAVRFEAIRLGAFTRRVHLALEGAGIEHLIMKGAAVAAVAWEDPSARPQNDVDVLLRDADVEPAAALLHEAGLVQLANVSGLHFHQVAMPPMDGTGCTVELHFALRGDPPLRVTVDELLSRKAPVATPEGELPTLCDEDAAVYLAVHAASHGFARIAWLEDLRGLAQRRPVDWSLAADRARAWAVALPTFLAWTEARRQLGAAIPLEALEQLGASRLRVALARWALEVLAGAGPRTRKWLEFVYQYSLLPGPLALLGAVRRSALMRADHKRRRTGGKSAGKLG